MTSLSLRGVTKTYGPTRVLEGVDLEVPARSITAVLGPVRLRQDDAAADRRRLHRTPTPAR